MKIPEKYNDRIKQRYSTYRGPGCPFCGGHTFVCVDTIYEVPAFMAAGPLLPSLAFLCNGCSLTLFVPAIKIGLIDKAGNFLETF